MKTVLSFNQWSRINEAEDAASGFLTTAMYISDKIVSLFSNTAFWEPYKGTFNDDESTALVAFNTWWDTNVQRSIQPFVGKTNNANVLNNLKSRIQEALLGSTMNDTVSWTITDSKGLAKEYSVDTDF